MNRAALAVGVLAAGLGVAGCAGVQPDGSAPVSQQTSQPRHQQGERVAGTFVDYGPPDTEGDYGLDQYGIPNRPGIPANSQRLLVTRVIDGDTVQARADEPGGPVPPGKEVDVDLVEIDAPEMGGDRCEAREAKRHLESLLSGGSNETRVYVTRDKDLRNGGGRYLLYAWSDTAVFVNLQMVADGYADPVLHPTNDKHWNVISAAEKQAAPSPYEYACYTPAPAPDVQGPADEDNADRDRGRIGGDDTGGDTGGNDSRGLPAPPPDLDCDDVSGPVAVGPSDPHGLDGDGDGVGCES